MTLSRRDLLRLGIAASAVPAFTRRARAWALDDLAAAAPTLASPIPLERVRLTGGPLREAQQADARYLLSLDPDRMLAYFRVRAGMEQRAEPYGGWDGGGRNLTGHMAGHHLSAISLMYAATDDARFRQRADYMVRELDTVQRASGDGSLVALEGGRKAFEALRQGTIRASSFSLNGEWSPWYTLHKLFAGLRDAWRQTGNRTALAIEMRFAQWAEAILAPLDDAQIQQMLRTEFGGMNEVLVDLARDTGDDRWMALSYKFEDRAFVDPLARHEDDLDNVHGNMSIPKLIGSADRHAAIDTGTDLLAASFFWDRVVYHHSFATGGHGTDEYWGPADVIGGRVDGRTAESCNVYNMLKLTRRLFEFRPDPRYADFHERALFNHALASINPADGQMCYMVPVGRGVQHEYQDPYEAFTCCVGTGMENHALHGLGLYYTAVDKLWVNQYAPSTAEWREAGARLEMETDFPEGETATLTLRLRTPRRFELLLRRPHWSGEGFGITVSPDPEAKVRLVQAQSSGQGNELPSSAYLGITREWHDGDRVELRLPKQLRLEPTPDMPERTAILWGPLVLAGDLGAEGARGQDEEERIDPPAPAPVLVSADRDPHTWLRRGDAPGHFRTHDAAFDPDPMSAPHPVDFAPFYRLHRRTYGIYWDLYSPEQWQAKRAEWTAAAEHQRRLEAATVGSVLPGDEASIKAANFQGSTEAGLNYVVGRPGWRTGGWLSFELPVEADKAMALVATWYNADRRSLPARFDILVDGTTIASPVMRLEAPSRFFEVRYPIPAELIRGMKKVTVRFQAPRGGRVAALFGVRMVRANEAP